MRVGIGGRGAQWEQEDDAVTSGLCQIARGRSGEDVPSHVRDERVRWCGAETLGKPRGGWKASAASAQDGLAPKLCWPRIIIVVIKIITIDADTDAEGCTAQAP